MKRASARGDARAAHSPLRNDLHSALHAPLSPTAAAFFGAAYFFHNAASSSFAEATLTFVPLRGQRCSPSDDSACKTSGNVCCSLRRDLYVNTVGTVKYRVVVFQQLKKQPCSV